MSGKCVGSWPRPVWLAIAAAVCVFACVDRHGIRHAIAAPATGVSQDGQVAAPVPGPRASWDFVRIVQEAMETHPSVHARHAAVGASRADLDVARWQRFPVPTLESAYDQEGDRSLLLRIQQPLWTGGQITAAIEGAEFRVQAAEVTVSEAQYDLVGRVIVAYAEALRQQWRMEYAERSVTEHDRFLQLIRRRVSQEVTPQIDERLAESRYYQAVNDRALTRQALEDALAQLSQLSGKSVGVVQSVVIGQGGIPDIPRNLEMALAQARQNYPALRRLVLEEQASVSDIDVKKSAYLPTLSARYDQSFLPSETADSRYMLVMDAKPGAGLASFAGVDAARARQQELVRAREGVERDLAERITLDWNDFHAARSRFEYARRTLEMAGEVSRSYAVQYTTGKKSWLDVMNALREEIQANFAAVDIKAQMTASGLRLLLFGGRLYDAVRREGPQLNSAPVQPAGDNAINVNTGR
jgi:adhesin transport system outer membrane protein